MIDYFKKHWIISFLIGLVWGVTIWITRNKHNQIQVESQKIDTIQIFKKDTTKIKVDSIVENIEFKKKQTLKKLHELENQKKDLEEKAKLEKIKRIEKEKEIELEKSRKKEVIKEKKVFVKDPILEKQIDDYQRENLHLKEELEKTCKANEILKSEQQKLQKIYNQEMIPDTIVKKKKKFGLF